MTNIFKGLRTLIYQVPDLDKAKEWYTGILGTPPYFDQPFYVGFSVAGYELGLQPMESASGSQNTNTYTYWGVDDVHTVYKQLLDAGATPLEEPADVGGEIVVAAVRDPWGNIFGIIYNPHFKAE